MKKTGRAGSRVFMIGTAVVVLCWALFSLSSVCIGTVYDLFSGTQGLSGGTDRRIHFTVNGQGIDMIIGTRYDNGALLAAARNDTALPYYRNRRGGLAVHVAGSVDRAHVSSPGALLSMLRPVMGFVNGVTGSTRYVSLRLDRGFDINGFTDTDIHDTKDTPVYPSAVRIDTIRTDAYAIGHYRAQATPEAVMLYYASRLQSRGYKRLKEKPGLAVYRAGKTLMIVQADEEGGGYVSIITYACKDR